MPSAGVLWGQQTLPEDPGGDILAQQRIPRSSQLALAGGGYWTVRRTGTVGPSDWDRELSVLAWGCVDNGF